MVKIFVLSLLLLSSPWLMVKLAAFVPTLYSLKTTIEEFQQDGSEAFEEDRKKRLIRKSFAIGLYLLGFTCLVGVSLFFFGAITTPSKIALLWSTIIMTSALIMIFEWPALRGDTPLSTKVFLLGTPGVMIAISVVGLIWGKFNTESTP